MGMPSVNLDRPEHERYEIPPFVLDVSARALLRDGRLVEITPKAVAVLIALVKRRGEPVRKEVLMREIWPDVSVTQANLHQQVMALRRSLGEYGEYIETVPARGYRFAGPIVDPEAAQLPESQAASAPAVAPDPNNGQAQDFAVQEIAAETETAESSAAPGAEPSRTRSFSSYTARLRSFIARPWILLSCAALALMAAGVAAYSVWSARTVAHPVLETLVPEAVSDGPRILARIRIPGGADFAALSPDETQLYVAKQEHDEITVIDTRTRAVTALIRVGKKPVGLAVSSDGSKLYVGLLAGASVIDLATKHVSPLDTGGPVQDLVISPDGKELYLAMGYSGVRKINLATGQRSDVSTIVYARALALSPNGKTLYVSYQAGGPDGSMGHDAIGYFDTETDRFLGSIHGFANVGECLTVSPDNTQIWENGGDACLLPSYDHAGCPFVPAGLVNIVRTSDHKLARAVFFEGTLIGCPTLLKNGVAMLATGSRLLLLDRSKFRIIGSVPLTSSGKVAVTRDQTRAYAPASNEECIAVLELARQVTAMPMANPGNSGETLPVAVLTTSDFDATSVDPTTLTLNGIPVERTGTGPVAATYGHIQGVNGLELIVNFPARELKPNSKAVLEGKTFSGISIRSTVQIGR